MRTIEQIENNFWGEAPSEASYLVKKIFDLRKKDIDKFEIEDIRVMISQAESLDILIPVAIEKLKEDLFAEGDYYQGDLLKSVLTSSIDFWDKKTYLKNEVIKLYEEKIALIKDLGLTDKILQGIFSAFGKFKEGR